MFQCCNCTQSRVSLLIVHGVSLPLRDICLFIVHGVSLPLRDMCLFIVHGVSLPLRDMCLFLRYYDINLPLITQGMSYITRND